MKKTIRRTGFTLVELLIVIGIIALLIAITIPALNAAREHAKRIKCMSNMRQLTAAWIMYANQNKGHFCSSEWQMIHKGQKPPYLGYSLGGIPPNKVPGNIWTWIADTPEGEDYQDGMLWPFLKDTNIYICPDDPWPPGTTYTINGYLAGRSGNPTLFNLSQIRRSESTFVFIERGGALGSLGNSDGDGDDIQIVSTFIPLGQVDGSFYTIFTPATQFLQLPGGFHRLGGSIGTPVSFADGHVIFWQYADTVAFHGLDGDAMFRLVHDRADAIQLTAWSGGTPPANVPQ